MHPNQEKSCTRHLVAALLVLAGCLAACEEPVPGPSAATQAEPPAKAESTCGNAGLLAGSLSGAIHAQLDLLDKDLRCESMPRPDSEGVRLRISGKINQERLVIIFALPTLDAGVTGEGFDSIVTITVEDSGRFFSTPNLDTCWTDVTTNEPLPDAEGDFKVVGSLSCVGPLGEINGDAFVDVRELRFSGVANWTRQ